MLEPYLTGLIGHIPSQLHCQWRHAGSFKLAMASMFMLWISASATNQSLSPGELVANISLYQALVSRPHKNLWSKPEKDTDPIHTVTLAQPDLLPSEPHRPTAQQSLQHRSTKSREFNSIMQDLGRHNKEVTDW